MDPKFTRSHTVAVSGHRTRATDPEIMIARACDEQNTDMITLNILRIQYECATFKYDIS